MVPSRGPKTISPMAFKENPLGIRVMLVDDHPVMRVGLANVLSLNHGFNIVAQADDGPSALQLWRKHRPDVCLLDVCMDRMDGIETLRNIRAEFPDARILMLTSSKDGDDMNLAMQSGARGYVVKTVQHGELAKAIRTVHEGGIVDPQLPASPKLAEATGPLSQRELEVLGLVRQGFGNDEIARLLGISERTVRAHMTAILATLNAADRAQAVAIGYDLGLFKPSANAQRL
jgi:DNA-binding NarL/FixJ family response regulator